MDSNKALREALRRTQEEANENSVEDDILKLMQDDDSDLLNKDLDDKSEELKKSESKVDAKQNENKKESVKPVSKKEEKEEEPSKTSLDEKKEIRHINTQKDDKKPSESELARVKDENKRKLEKKRVKKARQKSNVKSFDINSDENKKSAIRTGVNNNIYYTQVANVPRKMLRDIQSLVPEARNKDEAMIAYIVATNNITLTEEDNKYLNVDKINYLASSIRSNDTVIDSINILSRNLDNLDDRLDKQDKNQVRGYVQNEKILLALALLLSERLGFRQTGFTEASNVSFLEEVMLELLNKLDIDVKEKIKLDKERSGRPIR